MAIVVNGKYSVTVELKLTVQRLLPHACVYLVLHQHRHCCVVNWLLVEHWPIDCLIVCWLSNPLPRPLLIGDNNDYNFCTTLIQTN